MLNIKYEKGFSLIEFMITLAIVAILAAIAIPAYQDFTRKAHIKEMLQAAEPFKTAVSDCMTKNHGNIAKCDAGTAGIPANLSVVGNVASLTVEDGVIVVTPVATNGLTALDIYQLTPVWNHGTGITWTVSGGAVKSGLVEP
jgi:prepilin-type N-terminal cleavage/methylation domain-containing protein